MKIVPALICICAVGLNIVTSCKGKEEKNIQPLSTPKYEGKVDYSVPPAIIDLEAALENENKPLKLSQIASEIDYYIVGDGNYTVVQAISIPDSNAFLTFNNPRLYYRKVGEPSKRYGFKALSYKWNNDINEQNLFYDKKTTRLYVALSGKDQNNQKSPDPVDPQIAELPPLDTMLTIDRYVFPETAEKKYTIHLQNDKLLGFSSNGYMLSHYENSTGGIPNSLLTFNLAGEMLCQFKLKEEATAPNPPAGDIPSFQTYWWNETQDQMTFMIPFCDTVYQLRDSQTVVPLYNMHLGKHRISTGGDVADGNIWLRTLYENQQAIFIGMYQQNGPKILNWLDYEYGYKPTLSYQAVYLKNKEKTYILSPKSPGFINDLDDGFNFWPDGQTDGFLYMISTLTEMRTNIKRTGSPRQQKLLELIDNPKIKENQYVMIVVK